MPNIVDMDNQPINPMPYVKKRKWPGFDQIITVLMLPVIVFVTITLSFGIIKTTYDNSSNIRMLLTETSIQLEAIANS